MSILSIFRCPAPPAQTEHQLGVQARAISYLIRHGVIDAVTVINMGTTDAHKMFTRMRRMGLLYAADNPKGHFTVPNKQGSSCRRYHYWTGKKPAGKKAS